MELDETTGLNSAMNSTIVANKEQLANGTEAEAVLYMLSFLSLMGTSGNALVLYVFIRRKDKLVSTVYIISLAVVDFITCLVVIPFTVYMERIDFVIQSDAACKVYQFLITSNIPFSAHIMVAIAVDRYLCICHPWLSATVMNVRRAKIVVTILGVFSITIGVIVGLMYGVHHRPPASATSTLENSSMESGHSNQTEAIHNFISTTPLTEPTGLMTYQRWNVNRSLRAEFGFNDSEQLLFNWENETTEQLVNTGHCDTNDVIIGEGFQWYYQRVYVAMYVVCLIVVVVLYVAIFWSVTARRNRKQRLRSRQQASACAKTTSERITLSTMSLVGNQTVTPSITTASEQQMSLLHVVATCSKPPEYSTNLQVPNGLDKSEICRPSTPVSSVGRTVGRAKTTTSGGNGELVVTSRQRQHESTFLANLRTAAMLFVVTVVFIVTFTPGFLMTLEWLPFNMTVFYLYFANNVANPVIYSFMNPNFRADLRKLICPKS